MRLCVTCGIKGREGKEEEEKRVRKKKRGHERKELCSPTDASAVSEQVVPARARNARHIDEDRNRSLDRSEKS